MTVHRVTQVSQTKPWCEKLGYDITLYGRYTYGIAGEKFFREIKDKGRLIGTKCKECDLVYLPPQIYCERCFSELDEWVEIHSKATIHTFAVAHRDLDDCELAEPQAIAMVKFDGVHGGLVHRLSEVATEDIEIGMPVEIVFKPEAERTGSILDIEYFRPVKR